MSLRVHIILNFRLIFYILITFEVINSTVDINDNNAIYLFFNKK